MTLRMTIGAAALAAGALALAPAARAEDGASLFTTHCAKCHGESGKSDTPAGTAMKVPQLAGNAKVAGLSGDAFLAAFKANPKHKPLEAKLTDDQLKVVGEHVKGLAAK